MYLLLLEFNILLYRTSDTRQECIEQSEEPVNTISLSNEENIPHKTEDKCFE